ncbi:lysylphosphatidylglycerol synthase transmembrane domain-containing protein [Spirosoma sp. SC4-14]|uniref:lysylphosphatidylglycerol synthase transmembrane domain-containing protein n=1 Tax=Spirosoma sp. SC4-14 TaxID=3128900 RepID=UPI0030CC76E6
MKRLLRRFFPIGLAIALLFYALKDSSLTDIGAQFRQANYRWLVLTGILIALYNVVRAARWQLTLQAIGYQPSLYRATIAVLAGTMASLIVPGAGELTRCGTLQRTDNIPVAHGFGSVVAERVIDLLMLGILIGLTLLVEFKRIGHYFFELLSPVISRATSINYTGLLTGFITFGFLLAVFFYWLFQQKTFRQHTVLIKLVSLFGNIGQGFMSIRKLQQPGLFASLTLVSYLLIYLTTYSLFFASYKTIYLPPTAALSIITISSLGGMAVPTQGGLGTYHYLVSRVLLLYGLPKDESIAMATFMHAVQTGFALLFSSLSFLIVPVLIRKKNSRINEPMV